MSAAMVEPEGVSLQDWVGREERVEEQIAPAVVRAMAATLDLDSAPGAGEPLPPGWHWLFFNPTARRSLLGQDGHPQRGGFLPPVLLPRRMWAGGRLRYESPLAVGAEAARISKILKVEPKVGKGGALCFVTVEHTITSDGAVRIVEEQDIVYREQPPTNAGAKEPARHEAEAQWSAVVTPDPTLLFRYSALTFNGHRIHYDQPYARHEEGYRDLVVHGPLIATLLQGFAVAHGDGRRMTEFSFRGISPLFVDRSFTLEARADGASLEVWARGPDGDLAMSAKAAFSQ